MEIIRLPSAGEAQQLAQLPAPFVAVMFASKQRIKKIKFTRINGGVFVVGKQRWNGQCLLGFFLFGIKKRAGSLRPLAVFKCQFELIKKKTGRNGVFTASQPCRGKKQNSGAKPVENCFETKIRHGALSLLAAARCLFLAFLFIFNIDIDFILLSCILFYS
ncbi:MAG TPA: hypothetical protein VIK53_03410 [Verrucomicrobiae bacterium]